jgi:hypothetical protein
MSQGFILDTAHWLCDVEAEGGGWGIVPKDDDAHKPITGEVAYALGKLATRDERVEAKLEETKDYFSNILDSVPTPRSVVHLCWIVLGSFACGIPLSDSRIVALLEQLERAHLDGWAWPLEPKDSETRAIYPTYLALLVTSEARSGGRVDDLRLESAGIWLMNQRGPDLLWPSDSGAASAGRRVLDSAYAILGLYYAFAPQQFQSSVVESLPVLSEAALELPSEEAVVIETPDSDDDLPDWHHCVIPQVAWTKLRLLGVSAELDSSPLPELLTKCVVDMWREEDKTWLDPSRNLASPYLAADVLRVMTAYATDTNDRLVAPELAVRMVTGERKAKAEELGRRELEQRLTDRNSAPVVQRKFAYETRHLGFSNSVYWSLGGIALLAAVVAAVLGEVTALTAGRLAVVLAAAFAYLPLKRKLGVSGGDTFWYVTAVASIVALLALVPEWLFQ